MARAIGINHVALEVGDVDEALDWYGRFVQFELRGRRPTMAWIDLGDQFLALSAGRRQGPDDGRHFGLVVDDKEAVRAALAAAGVDVAPAWRPGRRMRRAVRSQPKVQVRATSPNAILNKSRMAACDNE